MNGEEKDTPSIPRKADPITLAALAWSFLRIGSVAFGGFMMLVSMVEREFVRRRKLIGEAEMLETISLVSLLPGPMAVNLVAWTGYRVRGISGAAVAMGAVIVPGFVLIWVMGLAYLEYSKTEAMMRIFDGLLAALAAVVADVALRMARKNATDPARWALVVAVAVVTILLPNRFGFFTLLGSLLVCGMIGRIWFRPHRTETAGNAPRPSATPIKAMIGKTGASAAAVFLFCIATWVLLDGSGWLRILGVFSGLSLLLFGGAYVFIPLMQGMLVGELDWLSNREFLDAVAMGQVLPGPNLVSVAFIGGQLAGLPGMLAATVGIFVPSAVLTIQASRVLDVIKDSPGVRGVMAGVQLGVIGAIAASAWTILKAARRVESSSASAGSVAEIQSLPWSEELLAGGIFALALFLLIKHRVPLYVLLPLAGLAGWAGAELGS